MGRSTLPLAALFVLTLGVGAMADEDLDKAKAGLAEVTKAFEAMGPGDVAAANGLMRDLTNKVVHHLKQSTERGKPAWNEVLKEGQTLEAAIKARAQEAPPPDQPILEARALMDSVEAALATLAPGDVPAANAQIAVLNEAVEKLKASKANRAPEWKEQAARHPKLVQAVTARAKEPAGPAPAAPKPGAPATPAAPATPTSPAAPAAPAGSFVPAQSIPDLQFNDKRMLGIFDKDFDRAKRWLANAKTSELQDPKTESWTAHQRSKLEDALARMSPEGQAHAQTAVRRAQLAAFLQEVEAKRSESFSALSKDDVYYIGKTKEVRDRTLATLERHRGTVLTTAGPTQFDPMVAGVREFLAKIKNQGHPDVKALAATVEALAGQVAERRAESEAKRAELGDVRAELARRMGAFEKGYPPALADARSPEAAKAFADAVAMWRPRLDDALAYIARAAEWSPELGEDVDLRNKVGRFRTDRPYQLKQVVDKAIGGWSGSLRDAENVDPEALQTSDLRQGASIAKMRLDHAVPAIAAYKAYASVLPEGAPDLGAVEARLQAKRARIDERIAQQLESERFPKPETEADPGLLAIARDLAGGSAVKRLELWRGKRSKQYEEEKVEGTQVVIYKWDYDFFSAHSVREMKDGTYWVFMHVFCNYRLGYGKEKGVWLEEETHKLYRIQEHNIGK